MTVEFTDMEGKTIRPPGEPLWRGVDDAPLRIGTMEAPAPQLLADVRRISRGRNLSTKLIRQNIKLEPNDSPTLFAIRPIRYTDAGPRVPPFLNPVERHAPAARSASRLL